MDDHDAGGLDSTHRGRAGHAFYLTALRTHSGIALEESRRLQGRSAMSAPRSASFSGSELIWVESSFSSALGL